LLNGTGPPKADAGEDQTVTERDDVVLDGSESTSPDGSPLSYSWTQTAGPSVTLEGAETATPSFTAPTVEGEVALTFELTVDNSEGSDTDTTTVTVEGINEPPTADAGEDRVVGNETSVPMDGTASSDPEDDPLSYSWTQTGGPDVTLADAATSTPTFTAPDVDTETTLTFELTVDDGNATDTDTVVITIVPLVGPPPVTGENPPTDINDDGLYEDINGDESFNIFDVQALFIQFNSATVQNNPEAFNFNGDSNPDAVTIFDVQGLFVELANQD
jgi:PKD repeat protein